MTLSSFVEPQDFSCDAGVLLNTFLKTWIRCHLETSTRRSPKVRRKGTRLVILSQIKNRAIKRHRDSVICRLSAMPPPNRPEFFNPQHVTRLLSQWARAWLTLIRRWDTKSCITTQYQRHHFLTVEKTGTHFPDSAHSHRPFKIHTWYD